MLCAKQASWTETHDAKGPCPFPLHLPRLGNSLSFRFQYGTREGICLRTKQSLCGWKKTREKEGVACGTTCHVVIS